MPYLPTSVQGCQVKCLDSFIKRFILVPCRLSTYYNLSQLTIRPSIVNLSRALTVNNCPVAQNVKSKAKQIKARRKLLFKTKHGQKVPENVGNPHFYKPTKKVDFRTLHFFKWGNIETRPNARKRMAGRLRACTGKS